MYVYTSLSLYIYIYTHIAMQGWFTDMMPRDIMMMINIMLIAIILIRTN